MITYRSGVGGRYRHAHSWREDRAGGPTFVRNGIVLNAFASDLGPVGYPSGEDWVHIYTRRELTVNELRTDAIGAGVERFSVAK